MTTTIAVCAGVFQSLCRLGQSFLGCTGIFCECFARLCYYREDQSPVYYDSL